MTRKPLGALTLITGIYVLLAAIFGPAKVISACSPMTRMPLPTVERAVGGVR